MPDPGPLPARLGPLPAARAVPTPTWQRCVDVVVVGSGAAGLSCALTVAAAGRSVLMMTKGDLGDGATRSAQGGLAAVNDPADRVPDHVEDTLRAGAGLCDDAAPAPSSRPPPPRSRHCAASVPGSTRPGRAGSRSAAKAGTGRPGWCAPEATPPAPSCCGCCWPG